MAGNLPPGIGELSFENNKGGGGRVRRGKKSYFIFTQNSMYVYKTALVLAPSYP